MIAKREFKFTELYKKLVYLVKVNVNHNCYTNVEICASLINEIKYANSTIHKIMSKKVYTRFVNTYPQHIHILNRTLTDLGIKLDAE